MKILNTISSNIQKITTLQTKKSFLVGIISLLIAVSVIQTTPNLQNSSYQTSFINSSINIMTADQIAINYVSLHYSGNVQSKVLKTEPDHEHGIAVYDVRVLAPNNSTYIIHINQRTGAILSVNLAEKQVLNNSQPIKTVSPITPTVNNTQKQQTNNNSSTVNTKSSVDNTQKNSNENKKRYY